MAFFRNQLPYSLQSREVMCELYSQDLCCSFQECGEAMKFLQWTEVTSELYSQDLCFQGCGEVLGKTSRIILAFWRWGQVGGGSPLIPQSFISSKTFKLKIHERQSSYNRIFFQNIKITRTKDVSVVGWRFFIFFAESSQLTVEVLIQDFELSVCNFEIFYYGSHVSSVDYKTLVNFLQFDKTKSRPWTDFFCKEIFHLLSFCAILSTETRCLNGRYILFLSQRCIWWAAE